MRVPFGDQNLLKLPDNIPFEKGKLPNFFYAWKMLRKVGLYLSDVLPTSYHSVCDTGVFEGDSVAIWVLVQLVLWHVYGHSRRVQSGSLASTTTGALNSQSKRFRGWRPSTMKS